MTSRVSFVATSIVAVGMSILALMASVATPGESVGGDLGEAYVQRVRPLLAKYCFECHSKKVQKGDLDLEQFESLTAIQKNIKPWQHVIEQVDVGEMPPRGKPQPSADERTRILAWVRAMIDKEARSRTGDPGRVPLRRLSNAEYDATIRDLTGVDLRPTREFPVDGAAGEGFTNAAESLSDVTPTLFTRYLNAAKDVADHAVLLPDGFRFSSGKTRRDWSDESVAKLRQFYAPFKSDGRLNIAPYLAATVRHRAELSSGKTSLAEVASRERLNAKYLGILWRTLNDASPSPLLDEIRASWRIATEKDVDSLTSQVSEWQTALWRFVLIGSYRDFATVRQVANEPVAAAMQTVKLAVKPGPTQADVTLYLATRDLANVGAFDRVVWQRPRLEGAGRPPLLLKDYPEFGIPYEINLAKLFDDVPRYLAAAASLAHDASLGIDDAARKNMVDPALLRAWVKILAIEPSTKESAPVAVPIAPLQMLDTKTPKDENRPSINGWRPASGELPVVLSNSSDAVMHIPGTMRAHRVAVHPMPQEFVAIAWKSPVAGNVDVAATVIHVHPACGTNGNGVAWRLERRRGDKAHVLSEGELDPGKDATPTLRGIGVEPGDQVVFLVEARAGNHFCDLTETNLVLVDPTTKKTWDLTADVADSIQSANPHSDRHGNQDTWSFARGATKALVRTPRSGAAGMIPKTSTLGRWRIAAADPARRAEAETLAGAVRKLLTGPRPTKDGDPDRALYDAIVAGDGVLLKGLDPAILAKARPDKAKYGLPAERFGHPEFNPGHDANLVADANSVVEIRLPAALLRDREFVVEGLVETRGDRVVVFQASTKPPSPRFAWSGKGPIVATAESAAFKAMLAGHAEFRRVFPWYLCFPNVVPTDEVVSLKMFHREDEPLERLFLSDEQKRTIDRLWDEHRFISQQPIAENDYLPQFIGYVTQDNPKALVDYFESQRPVFKKRADDFENQLRAAEPKHLAMLADFASRAYRRPLDDTEKAGLDAMYRRLREKNVTHDEAFRGVLTRVLAAPAFLFRIEKAPPGTKPGYVDDWELAARLSYFLWSSAPDAELRDRAAAGALKDPSVLAAQTKRMLKDDRLRSLAIEFGTQWIHVRDVDTLKEKNEKLFPAFTPELRQALREESVLFFLDLFQNDRPVSWILDADATFLNEDLAKHYGIPGVKGTEWRRVEGVRKFGRGGILGLGSVHAKQSGASRTSPVLRGNWVVETLLGEKLPRPPADVPPLADEEAGANEMTTRQQVEKHVSVAACATCHVRIDPYGFAFENFDAIGRWRVKDSAGRAIDAKAKLRDGAEFDGINGLRDHLLSKKKDVIVRLFCQRLLGYALGRATTLSDTTLIDEMVSALNANDGRVNAAILAIVRSPQFRMIRGSDVAIDD